MKTRKRELAKVGIFGAIDNPTIVTEKDLLEIAETFADQQSAPVQFGHWADAASPRLGNVVAVEYDPSTKTLSGEVQEQDALFDAVEQGYFPDCSIGAKKRASDGKMYLHHLAYLGEEPPAIKDLKKEVIGNLDNVTNQIVAAEDGKDCIQLPSCKERQLYLSDFNTKEITMTQEEITALQEENARLKAENEANAKLLSDQNKKCFDAEKTRLADAVKGKLCEQDSAKLLALCDAFADCKTIELCDAQNNKTVQRPLAVLADIFEKISLPVEPGAINLSDPAPKAKSHFASMMQAM